MVQRHPLPFAVGAVVLAGALAILIDATVIRMVLVPAVMELLGARNWWMPAWLERRLPRLAVELGS